MRVLQINAVYGIASTGRTMLELNEELELNNIETYVAYAVGNNSTKTANKYIIGNVIDRKIHALLSRLTGLQGYFSIIVTLNLISYIKRIKPDIIHLRNLHNNYVNFNMLVRYIKKNKIPLVLTLHDSWFYTGKNQAYNIDFSSIPKDYISEDSLESSENPSWFFDRSNKIINDRKKLFEDFDNLNIVGVSKWVASEAQKSFLGKNREIKTIYNWIDTSIFKPTESVQLRKKLNLENKFIILGVSSFWTKNKGLNVFLNLSKLIDDHSKIILVGNISGKIELPDNIIHISNINDSRKLADLYSLADVFLNISVAETFGKVCAESLACGTPVITNKFTANPEIVTNRTGIVINQLDYSEILKSLNIVRDNTKDYYTDACIERVGSYFNRDKNTKQYVELYEEILKGV